MSQDEDSDGYEEEKYWSKMLVEADLESDNDSDYNPSEMDVESYVHYLSYSTGLIVNSESTSPRKK